MVGNWIDEVSTVACPSCGAPPGEYCNGNGDLFRATRRGDSVHLVRWEAYDKQQREPLLVRKMREAIRDEAP